MNGYPGKLIVLYGINNLGKSTQAKLLVNKLQENGYQAEYLKYPIYDLKPSGEILNDYLRKGNFFNLSAKEAQIIYALNRTQYQTDLIAKLKAGINVIAEDYKGTGIAWGLGAGVSETFLKNINSHLIDEDIVFLFDGERFKEAVENGHKHENNDDLTNKVRWAHLKLKEEYGWIKINANLAIEEISNIIWQKTKDFLENKHDGKEKTPENKYNYSGFNAVGDIINKNHQNIIEQLPETKKEQNSVSEIEKDINNIIRKELPSTQETIINKVIADKKEIIVEKVNESAKIPTKAHQNDAGFDLYANDYCSIAPYGHDLVPSGIKMSIPEGFVGLIWDKSGLASQGITTMGGVIDSGYHGEIKVVVKNLSEDMLNIVPGQKIAQIIIQESPKFDLKENKINNSSERSDNGFGSSGKF